MGKFKDLTGMKFGRLTVIKRTEDYVSPSGEKKVQWLCECSCENKTRIIVMGSNLTKGNTESCGCLAKEKTIKRNKSRKRYNQYDLSGEYGIGYTSKGEKFYFDLEDYDKIKDYCWYKNAYGYIVASDENGKEVRFHSIIFPNAEVVDHIHGEQSRNDNRKGNIRPATQSQNSMNRKRRSDNNSGVTGVYWIARNKKWGASITIGGKTKFLGSYDNFEDAVTARKTAEDKYFGEFSYDNSVKKE